MTDNSAEPTPIRTFFAKGTLVTTRDGQKPIEEVVVGDWVLSFPHAMTPPKEMKNPSEAKYRQVTNLGSLQADRLVEVSVMDLAAGFKETVGITPSSLIYQTNIGWSPASDMAFGCTLENSVFGNLLVTKAKQTERFETVYGISVEEFCTYYTGKAQTWVHC